MNTNNAAALERLECDMCYDAARQEAEKRHGTAALMRQWANELAALRATLAQPDALTSQPSGEAVAWLVDYPKFPGMRLWSDEASAKEYSGHCGIPAQPLFTHPSADAPGVAVDEWPELPKASIPEDCDGECVHGPYYTADQMREYALAAMRVRGEQ